MFTGIVQSVFSVPGLTKESGKTHFSVNFSSELLSGLKIGASVSVDGVCLTVVRIEGNHVAFDAIEETLERSTLGFLEVGHSVNIERAAKWGDEIGGHLLSGHIYGKACIERVDLAENFRVVTLKCPPAWMKYFFTKGYIALNGVSLTLVKVDPAGLFSVHLIPETLRATTFRDKKPGDWVNVELDAQTQAIVDTVERMQPIR